MRVLYLGPTWHGSNAQSFRRAFEILGHEVTVLDSEAEVLSRYRSLPMRIGKRLLGRPLRRHVKRAREVVLEAVRATRPELVFAVKALSLDAQVLEDARKASGALLVHWHPDDYMNPEFGSADLDGAIPVYDVCITTKTFNLTELPARGARRVVFLPFAYDPEVHFPVPPRDGPPSQACFVGGWEGERAGILEHAAREGVDLEVWGSYWHKLSRNSPLRPHCTFREVLAGDMARVFASCHVALGFLRKAQRDLQTARTFEIPASGGVMLTERTDEQRAFFEEGREALYFGSKEEMVSVIREYAARPADIARIRAAALERCRRERYTYVDRVQELLAQVAG